MSPDSRTSRRRFVVFPCMRSRPLVRAVCPIRREIRGWRTGAAAVLWPLLAALSATPAFGIGWRMLGPFNQPKHETISARLHLSPSHRAASLSHRFIHATVGFDSIELVVPRGLPAELLIRTSVESLTSQPPDVHLCTPDSFCQARGVGVAVLHRCHDSGGSTICEEKIPGRVQDPIFEPGLFVMTVREFKPTYARVSLRMVFVRGPGA
jgi:hypothetical protein